MEQAQELEQLVRRIVTDALLQKGSSDLRKEVPIGVSNRHIHLSPNDVKRLFGANYELKRLRDLSQPGQYACQETLTIIGPKGKIAGVRVLGPARGDSQVEISLTDGYALGVTPPIRDSGDIADTPGIILQGPRGRIQLDRGLICASRHIHMHPDDAVHFGVQHGDLVRVGVTSLRRVVFHDVRIRVSPKYRLEMHIDTDEANGAGIRQGDIGVIE